MPKIELQSDSDAFESLAREVATMYMDRSGNNYVQSVGNDFINTVGFAMHLRPEEEKIKEGKPSDSVFFSQKVIDGIQHVIDSIQDYGGNDPYMIIYPVVFKIEKPNKLFDNILSLPLFRVRNKNNAKESKYVDTVGRTYSGPDDFINNAEFPKCEIWYPTNLIFTHDSNGKAQISHGNISPSNMKYVDVAVSVLCLGAGALAMFTGIGIPFAVVTGLACAAYGIGRSTETLVDRAEHGQTINPFASWDAFNAWAGIAANAIGFGLAGNAIRLSANMAEMAAAGLRITETTEWALSASIRIPQVINGGLMFGQLVQMIKHWKEIPVEHKIIIGLQFIFFAASSYKIGILSSSNIEEKVANISYNELTEELVRQADNSEQALVLRSNLRAATDRVGGISIRAIKFFKKLVNYNRGKLITMAMNENNSDYITLTEEGDEIGFEVNKTYFACAEAAMDINDGVNSEPDQPSSSRSLSETYRLPESDAVSQLAKVKRFVPKNEIETAKSWLKNLLGVEQLEDYLVNGVKIFKNMQYHEQIRLKVFEVIGKSLNEGLKKACVRFAEEGNAKTVGQYASDYEIASLQIHKEANELALNFKGKTRQDIQEQYHIDIGAGPRRNAKNIIMEHWNNNFDYDAFKARLTTMINIIKEQCEDYVGHGVVRAGLDHDSTVSDIQSLESVRFRSIEQAICHALKHGKNFTSEAVKEYFDTCQDIIQYSKTHPENVSSTWTQTGSARDFTFYRKVEGGSGVERAVVLVSEDGETILKTYFKDKKMPAVPAPQKHSFREPVDIKHASLLTFYFQLMLLAPRYGVLLPKDYELFDTKMDAKKSHTIIIMAGHYFEDGDSPNLMELAKALNNAFPTNVLGWNIVAIKVGSSHSFEVYSNKDHYIYCRIKNYRFVIFTPPISSDKTVKIIGDKHKYSSYAKQGTVIQNLGFNDETLDLANRICSHTTEAKEISAALKEVFGGYWSCIRLSYNYVQLHLKDVYLSLNLTGDEFICYIFRC